MCGITRVSWVSLWPLKGGASPEGGAGNFRADPSPSLPALSQELVQVETLAQLGALLLLFGLGMELSLAKLRSVWNVAVLGGALQVRERGAWLCVGCGGAWGGGESAADEGKREEMMGGRCEQGAVHPSKPRPFFPPQPSSPP